ncbi:MAG: hypothetical protein SGPRY_014685, partial [Prymnesium sp.]
THHMHSLEDARIRASEQSEREARLEGEVRKLQSSLQIERERAETATRAATAASGRLLALGQQVEGERESFCAQLQLVERVGGAKQAALEAELEALRSSLRSAEVLVLSRAQIPHGRLNFSPAISSPPSPAHPTPMAHKPSVGSHRASCAPDGWATSHHHTPYHTTPSPPPSTSYGGQHYAAAPHAHSPPRPVRNTRTKMI